MRDDHSDAVRRPTGADKGRREPGAPGSTAAPTGETPPGDPTAPPGDPTAPPGGTISTPGGTISTPGETPPGETASPGPAAEFGPRGYLPPRAAKRARKIVLREQLGVGWIIASVLAGLVLLGAGAWFVAALFGPPGPPFVASAIAADLAPASAARVEVDGTQVLLVRAGGRLRAFSAPATAVVHCPDSGRLEGADGTVWDLDGGRRSAAGASLAEVALEVHDGTVYVDPTTTVRTAAARDESLAPVCDAPAG